MLKQKIIKSLGWSISLKILSIAIQIGTLSVLGRLLLPADFGTMGVLLLLIGFSKIFSEFGLGAALVQKESVTIADRQNVLFISIIIAGVLNLLTFLSADFIASYFENANLAQPLRVISFIFLIDSTCVIQQSIAQKQMDFKFMSTVYLISYFVGNCVVTILLALLGYEYWSLVVGYMVNSLVILFAYIFRYGFLRPKFTMEGCKRLFSYGSFFTIGRILNYFANQADYFVVGKILGTSSLGYYTRSYQLIASPANLIGGTLQQVLFPAFSTIQKDTKSLKKYYFTSNRILAYPSLFIGSALIYGADDVVRILLGSGWEATVFPLKVLALGLVFKLGYKTSTPIMNALGLVKIRSYVELIYCLSILILSFFGAKYGIDGVSVGVLLSLFINFVISNLFVCRALSSSFLDFLRQYIVPVYLALTIWACMFMFSYNLFYFGLLLILVIGLNILLFLKGFYNFEVGFIKNIRK